MTSGRNNNWTAGNALSWVMGVLLGGLIGTILLIAVPRSLGGGHAEAPASAVASTTGSTEGTASSGAGASGEQAPGTTSAATEASTAGEANTAVQTPAATAEAGAGDAAAGKEKFAGTCAGCHGANAEGGMGGMAPKLNTVKDWTEAQFTAAVREGKAPEKTLGAAMPHFAEGQISAEELANIHAFLNTLN